MKLGRLRTSFPLLDFMRFDPMLLHPSDRRLDRVHIRPNILAVGGCKGPGGSFAASGCIGVAEPRVLAYSILQIPHPRRRVLKTPRR